MKRKNADFEELVRYAGMAPSGHNTQPWKFRMSGDSVTVLPDFECALPVVDGNHRELFISLGCAVENLLIAAGNLGYEANVAHCSEAGIEVRLTASSQAVKDDLFRQIPLRRTNRGIYNGDSVPAEKLQTLAAVPCHDGVQVYFTGKETELARQLAGYIVQGNQIQMNDTGFKNELISWMRFNPREVREKRDGLSYRVFGNPALPRWMAKPIVRCFLKGEKQNKTDLQKVNSASHLVLFTLRNNGAEEWINLGRTLQRFLLQATANGIACAFLNQPCEVETLAAEMRERLPIHRQYPALLLRIGYAAPQAYSPRKEAEEILV